MVLEQGRMTERGSHEKVMEDTLVLTEEIKDEE